MSQNPWRLAFGGMAVMAAGLGVGRFIYTPILPVMAEALDLSASQAGLIASANFLGYLTGALLAALKGFRASPRSTLLVFLAVNAMSLAAMGMTENYAAHLALRFVQGLAGAFILVFASALVLERLAMSGRNGLSTVHFGGVGIGIALSAIVVAVLLAQGAGWQALWYASALIGLAGLALAALLIEPAASKQAALTRMPVNADSSSTYRTQGLHRDGSLPLPLGEVTSGPAAPPAPRFRSSGLGISAPNGTALRAMIIAYGLFGFGYVITATFIVAIVRGAPEVSTMEPYVWALLGLSAAPSVALWIKVAEKSGVIPAYAIASLVQAAGVASSILWISTAGLVVAVLFLGGTFMGMTALGLMAARALSSGDPRVNLALMTASFGVGQAIGPTFAGLLVDRLGSFAAPSLTASAGLIVAAGLAWYAEIAKARNVARTVAHGEEAA